MSLCVALRRLDRDTCSFSIRPTRARSRMSTFSMHPLHRRGFNATSTRRKIALPAPDIVSCQSSFLLFSPKVLGALPNLTSASHHQVSVRQLVFLRAPQEGRKSRPLCDSSHTVVGCGRQRGYARGPPVFVFRSATVTRSRTGTPS